jgi:large repetitive protein
MNVMGVGSSALRRRCLRGVALVLAVSIPLLVGAGRAAAAPAPVAVNDSYTTDEDVVLTITAIGVLTNDTPADGSLTADQLTDPTHGDLSFSDDGAFTYTPDADYYGSDSFTYQAFDGETNSSPATVTITIDSVNDAPDAVADAYGTDEDTPLEVPAAAGVLDNDTDVEDDPIVAVLATDPPHGSLTLNDDGSFSYTPDADFHGPDSFTYTATEATSTIEAAVSAEAASEPVVVALTVDSVNDAPVAVANSYTMAEDTVLTVPAPGLLNGDSDVDGDELTVDGGTDPAHGSLAPNPDGSFVYTPAADFNGTDTFTYEISDGAETSAPATVTITVTPVAEPVTAPTKHVVVNAGSTVGVDINDIVENPSGLALTLISHTDGAHGTVTCSGLICTYTPDAGFSGLDAWTYTFRTADGDLVTGTVTVTVLPGLGSTLPNTGADTGSTLRLGILLVLTGAAMLAAPAVIRRRRLRPVL